MFASSLFVGHTYLLWNFLVHPARASVFVAVWLSLYGSIHFLCRRENVLEMLPRRRNEGMQGVDIRGVDVRMRLMRVHKNPDDCVVKVPLFAQLLFHRAHDRLLSCE